jgi:hypothetical protein
MIPRKGGILMFAKNGKKELLLHFLWLFGGVFKLPDFPVDG